MTKKQYPRAGCTHIGANYRHLTRVRSEGYEDLTMQSAFAMFEAEERERGHSVDARDKREFFRGWRAGKAQYAIRNLGNLMRYLNAEELEQLGEDLYGMARSWGAIVVDDQQEQP